MVASRWQREGLRHLGDDAASQQNRHDSCLPVSDDQRNPVRILLADDNAARAGALIKVLAADPSLTILRPHPGQLLADAVAAQSPDVVLVDMARPDRDALDGIRVVTANAPR